MSDYNTDLAPGLSTGLGQAPQPPPVKPTDDELFGAAFRVDNSLGSVIQRMSRGSYTPQAGYNPVDDLKGWEDTEYLRNHGTTFLGSQSPQETQAIKAEIDQARKDRDALAAGGWNGTVAGLAMGAVDPTMFLPVGNAARMARLATVGGRAAEMGGSFAKMALMQSTAQEALLSASQPERTLQESAINVGANTILASLIGAGGYALLAKDGLLDKGITSLSDARTKLSVHNGTLEAYHGTPHDFEAFSTDKIGTGEGAQVYGHGLYFAENEGVGRSYRDALGDSNTTIGGKKYDPYDALHVASAQVEESGSRAKAIEEIKQAIERDPGDPSGHFPNVLRILESDRELPKFEGSTGNLYQVRINADPEHMLDWDKPLSEQSEHVREAVKPLMQKYGMEGNFFGSEIQRDLTKALGSKQAASSALSEAGIPGIKYLDQDSRKAGEGTRNFVVFDHSNVDITHKNGQPIKQGADPAATGPVPSPTAGVPGLPPEPAGTGQAMAAGAAPSDTRNLSPVPYGLDSIPGVGKMVSKTFPNLDVLTNGALPAKAALSEMVDTPIALMANKEGQTATRFGGPTIERELKQTREGLHYNTDQEMLKQWGSYLGQDTGPSFVQRQTGAAPEGKLSFDDFNAAVYDALSTGDTHPTPQVAAMAQWIRKNGLDPIKERALKSIEGFKENVSRPGETYAPRNWDKEKISANWNDFVSVWTDHLASEQTHKAQSQERLGVFQGALESHRATIDKYEGQIERLSKDADVIAARQEETTRVNKAANRRSETLRESQYRNEGGLRVDVPGKGIENARGGSLFETLARNRGNLLADRASAKISEIESLQTKMAAEIESHNSMREKIETEIAAWDGSSSAEAKAALKARAEAEKAREAKAEPGMTKKPERLTAADKAVDSAVRKILESERDLSRGELQSRAEEIASRMIGTPEGRLPYDASSSGEAIPGQSDLRGHTAHRDIDIPYEMAKPWLRRSATEALKSYTHSVLPDAMLAERFAGDPNLVNVMKDIEGAYAVKRAEAKSETAQNKLKSQMDADIKNVAAMRDRIRGTFAYDPTMQGLARFSQNALKVNNLISSHGMAVASLPDFAGVAFRHGIESAFKDAWVPFSASLLDNEAWAAVKAAGDEWKAFGIGIESHSASRNHALSDIAEHYRPNSKFERALTWASDKAFIANLLAPLTDIQKRMATNAVASNILRASEAVAGGKATAKQVQRLAEGNITEAQAARIWEQWSNNGGERVKGIILPNMDKWSDQAAALAFRGAVGRDVDIAVVQPGYGEIPKFMSKPGFNVLTQYKKFTVSATQRILISNLQRHDAGTMAGVITAVGMGMLAYRINTMASGQKFAPDAPTLFKEGISRGGILGLIDDSNSIVSKATGGKADIYRLIGADKPLSKFVSRDAASMFLGPTYGKLTNMMQIARGATHPSEWNESDTHALRMMTMGTNFPYLPQLFDKVEQGANSALGIPMKAKP